MKKSLSSGIVLVLCILLSSCVKEFSFSPQTVISVEDPQQRAVAEWFAWHFACPGGFVPIVQVGASDADVLLRTDASIPGCSYRIRVTGKKTLVEASSSAGFLMITGEPFSDNVADCGLEPWKAATLRTVAERVVLKES